MEVLVREQEVFSGHTAEQGRQARGHSGAGEAGQLSLSVPECLPSALLP